ncbi:MAG TPA: GAF domain-containing protein, partial [Longimicrobium sp.]|nr:GAF domain-containing protein [Longimicrobium sp.]
SFASASDEERRQKLHDYIKKVLISFRAVFSDIGELQLNVMFPNASGQLEIMHRFPEDVEYQANLALEAGQGGAGVAFASGNLLYIPRVKYRHGVSIGMPPPGNSSGPITYNLKELVYVPTNAEPYRSILSAPIHSATGVVGVLNIDARINNPFADSEFETAQVAASFIAMALDRYRTSS